MFTNLNSLLLSSLNRSGKITQVTSAVIFDTIVKIFKENKNIDISKYLISITLNGIYLKIKTNKPIINSEIINIEKIIKDSIILKLNQIGINQKELKIIYK